MICTSPGKFSTSDCFSCFTNFAPASTTEFLVTSRSIILTYVYFQCVKYNAYVCIVGEYNAYVCKYTHIDLITQSCSAQSTDVAKDWRSGIDTGEEGGNVIFNNRSGKSALLSLKRVFADPFPLEDFWLGGFSREAICVVKPIEQLALHVSYAHSPAWRPGRPGLQV